MQVERLTFDEYGCLLALVAKSRSEDPFTQVGVCALDEEGRVLGTGYNGLLPGRVLESWMFLEENRERKSDLFIHAESNLFSRLKRNECYSLYLTLTPCIKCCQNIAALNIKRVVYLAEYEKCNKYKDFLSFYDIDFFELNPISKIKIKSFLNKCANLL